MKIRMYLYCLLLGYLFYLPNAIAHQTSTAYLTGDWNNDRYFSGNLQIRLLDMEKKLGLDHNLDSQLHWGEVMSRREAIETLVQQSLVLTTNDVKCPLSLGKQWQVDTHFNESYLLLPLQIGCSSVGDIQLRYSGLFDIDSNHKLLVNLTNNEHSINRVIDKEQNTIAIKLEQNTYSATFAEYLKQGVIHIWIGLDHILFLLCLLLACVFGKNAEKHLRAISKQVIAIVTVFTIAHSLTLTATAMNWIALPTQWVEVAIAATVLIAALNNVLNLLSNIRLVTFLFGLLHGMGFASVLGELGIVSDQRWLSILAFNLGVELGQVLIVLLMLPLLLFLARSRVRSKVWLTLGSSLIAVMSVQWIIQRL